MTIHEFLTDFQGVFFWRQTAVILGLFLYGFLCRIVLRRNNPVIRDFFLAFPFGISMYCLSGFLLLITGIPFRVDTICCLMLLFFVIMLLLGTKRPYGFQTMPWYFTLSVVIGVFVLACFCTSGLLSVSVSNDSLYYYSMYGKALVHYGMYRPQFDVFLTDVGQGAAIIGALPHLFGFNETFGIQHFFNLSFLGYFGYALFNETRQAGNRRAFIFTALSILTLLVSMPYVIVSKWVMANVYFMETLFMTVYLAYELVRDEREREILFDLSVFITVLSLLRMEGTIMVLMILLCMSLLDFTNKELFVQGLLPMSVLGIAYDIYIFLIIKVSAPYTFLTKGKALIQIAGMCAVGIYFVWVRNKRFKFISEHLKLWLISGLVLVNGALFVRNPGVFIGNMKAFLGNLFGQSGWGIFPVFMLALLVLTFEWPVKLHYFDVLSLGYLLVTLAVCFAREGVLREGVGDSGNRVLLQIVPLLLFTVAMHVKEYCLKKSVPS